MNIYAVIHSFDNEDRLEFIAASESIALSFRNRCREQHLEMGDVDEYDSNDWRVEVWPVVKSEQEMKAKAKFPCNMNPKEYREWQQANNLRYEANKSINRNSVQG